MIPRAQVTAWRAQAPWPTDAQVEQDLILSRALVELFVHESVAETVAFRGGTALHKLFLPTPGRYSEDIDLVQITAGPIGPILSAIRSTLDPWLGEPKRKQSRGGVTMIYRFEATTRPIQPLRLKVEINTREHCTVLGIRRRPFQVVSPWFSGQAKIGTYASEELLGTKLRALYQRKKGRDLYDLWLALTSLEVDDIKIVDCFDRYLQQEGLAVSCAEFEENLEGKLRNRSFLEDIGPLLPTGVSYNVAEAGVLVGRRLIAILRGDSWKGTDEIGVR
ncbi:MAG TPA: nucleotidyl transferase AbiEii/AbiGii toxin family protein [Syntrophus sp. (in: bacteria)]|nr:nucleotidyl transferase AbiEii/AbiGii toxin family protein [Syntrophus sp. (in: bacteria)]